MPTVERILLIVNRAAGTGYSRDTAERLRDLLTDAVGEQATLRVEIVDDHPTARICASRFLAASNTPALIIAGGGGGTLRAVIEGICEGSAVGHLPGPERVRLGALRMGSGNVLAQQFGVPPNAEAGLRGIITNLHANRTVPCCVLRCEVGTSTGNAAIHHAATLGGFGQFGRIPGDLSSWHRRWPNLHRAAARLLGIENLTNVEYAAALLIRFVWCVLFDDSAAEMIEVQAHGRKEVMRLLSGFLMNFPLKAFPFNPEVRAEDEALMLYLIPLKGKLSALLLLLSPDRFINLSSRIRIEKSERVEIRLLDRDRAEFFLDEDPMTFHGQLTIQVAGSLAFVPGH